ncbi:two-component system sensor histidine kinase NtrB [Anaeroselena agilis]|uniref:histidine kinase n=1 Tax=Anaeroselena agilis TaxID=3063788 RepID=A0ABU3NV86_9FIRM|nr:ATP-binding protein [Selenomonadales bacterium 4137-cl]
MHSAEAWDNKVVYLGREEDYRDFFETGKAGIMYLDATLQVKNINREAERIFSLERSQVLGKRAEEAFSHCGDKFLRAFAVSEYEDFYAANVMLTKRDHTSYVHVDSLKLRDGEGGVNGVIVIVQDISAMKATLKQIQTTQMLMSLGELAAGVAHHVRAPLTTLSGYLQIMMNRVEDDRCSVRREVLEMLLGEVSYINNVVKELVLFAKPPVSKAPGVNVNRLLEEALLLVFKQMGGESVAIDKQLAEGLPTLTADGNLLKQALVNILQNAMEAMPEEGTLTLRSWLNAELNMLVVGIADTGAGVGPQLLARVFEPFYTTKLDRMGLGLPTAHRIVTEHGGFVNISSDEKVGTRVHVYLPIFDNRAKRVSGVRQQILNLH